MFTVTSAKQDGAESQVPAPWELDRGAVQEGMRRKGKGVKHDWNILRKRIHATKRF